MKHLKIHILFSFVFAFIITNNVSAQVDSVWLKHWNEAYKLKPSEISSKSRIASKNEPGIALLIKGTAYNPDGSSASDVIIHSYHRDAKGYDFGENDSEYNTWRIQGWAKTDKNGNFTFETIRPAADHLGREGGHIHFTTISEKYGKQWAPKVFFADDDLISDSQRQRSNRLGKFGPIQKVEILDGIQTIEVSIQLKNESDF